MSRWNRSNLTSTRAGRAGWLMLAIVAWATLGDADAARAELRVSEETVQGGQLTTFRLSVTPAAEPSPALKHRLALAEADRKTGDAATYYYRALLASPQIIKQSKDRLGDKYDKLTSISTPLKELPLDELRQIASSFDPAVVINLREATKRTECNWDWQVQTLPGLESISFLLPEMQATRDVSVVLLLRARLAVAEGRFDDAINELRMNYQMASDVALEPILISGLVGIAEASQGNMGVLELIGAKDSPNLYWALAELPRPLVDLRRAARSEMTWGFNLFPFLKDAEMTEHSPEEWARLLGEGLSQFQVVAGEDPNMVVWSQLTGQLAATGVALVTYPIAKQRLIKSGMDRARVEAMPVGQVVTIDAGNQYHLLADDLVKWMYVPYTVVRQRNEKNPFEKYGPRGKAMFTRGYGYLLGSLLLPALEQARKSAVRLEWQINALMAVEAIRMHAAEHGKLPTKLEEVTIVPVPNNPATGKSYEYRLDGDKAVMELPISDGFIGVAWRFEITLADQ